MTTPNIEELITYLRSFFIDENVSAIKANQIANALQSQAERIKTLEDQISRKETTLKGWLKENGPGGWIDGLRSQLDVEIKAAAHWMQESCTEHNENVRIRAQLADIAAAEPVSLATDQTDEFGEVIYREVFTRPMPAQDVTELVDCLSELCDIVEGVVEDKSSVGSLIDSFTTQPARTALSKYKGAKLC